MDETLLDLSGNTQEGDEDEDGDGCVDLSISTLTHDISTTSMMPSKEPLSLANTLKGGHVKGAGIDITFADDTVQFNHRNRNNDNIAANNISRLNTTVLDVSDEDEEETMALDTLLRRDSDTGAMCTLDEILRIASLNNKIQPIAMEEGREAGSMEEYFPDTSPVVMKKMATKSPAKSPAKSPTKGTPTTPSRNTPVKLISRPPPTPTRRSTRIRNSICDATLVDPSFDTSIISRAKDKQSGTSNTNTPSSTKKTSKRDTPQKGSASKSKTKK